MTSLAVFCCSTAAPCAACFVASPPGTSPLTGRSAASLAAGGCGSDRGASWARCPWPRVLRRGTLPGRVRGSALRALRRGARRGDVCARRGVHLSEHRPELVGPHAAQLTETVLGLCSRDVRRLLLGFAAGPPPTPGRRLACPRRERRPTPPLRWQRTAPAGFTGGRWLAGGRVPSCFALSWAPALVGIRRAGRSA